jgi:iron only hydrogenase large subunit-like protein
MGCIPNCPTDAIGMGEEGVAIDHERCIACGTCFHHCGHGAVQQISELQKVKEFLTAKRKVILSIDPACIAFLPGNMTIEQLAAAAQQLGFWDVADASEASAAVAAEYVRLIEEKNMDNIVFSACPVVQNLMEQFYPETLKYLAPVASPMIAHGRMLKRDFTSAAVVYVSTCAARLEESKDVRHSTEINAVLSIGELMDWFRQEGIDPSLCEDEPLLSDSGGIAELSAVSGGMLETVRFMLDHDRKQLCVDGVHNCKALLKELSQGKLSGCVIEMNACSGGCVGGTDGMTNEAEKRGRFAAAVQIRNYVDSRDRTPYFDTHGIAMANPTIDFSVGPYEPTESEIVEMLYQIGVGNPRQQKNCGQCGFPTCRERALAILHHKEAVSICRQVVQDSRRDVYSVLYENLPMAALLVDDSQRIVDFNQEAGSLFSMKRNQEKYIFEVMDPEDFQYVLGTGLPIRKKRLDIPDLYLRVEASWVPLKSLNMVLGLFTDITEAEEEESRQLQARLQSVEMAQKVIDKQMMVAQQIAYLLGETTAETKVTLNQIKRRILDEEDVE